MKSNAASIRSRHSFSRISTLPQTLFPQASIPMPVLPQVLATLFDQRLDGTMLLRRQPLRLRRSPETLLVQEAVKVVVSDDLPPPVLNPSGIRDGEPSEAPPPAFLFRELEVHIDAVVDGEEDPEGLPFGHLMAKWTLNVQVFQHSVERSESGDEGWVGCKGRSHHEAIRKRTESSLVNRISSEMGKSGLHVSPRVSSGGPRKRSDSPFP